MSIATKIDLTEAVDAAARAVTNKGSDEDKFSTMSKDQQRILKQTILELILPAVPVIAAAAVEKAAIETSKKVTLSMDALNGLLDVASDFRNV